jgi:hypothetical protein
MAGEARTHTHTHTHTHTRAQHAHTPVARAACTQAGEDAHTLVGRHTRW